MDDLVTFSFERSVAAEDLRGSPSDLAAGSKNLIPMGQRQFRPWRGLVYLGQGAQRMFPAKDTWAGLDHVGGQDGAGSVFTSLADTLFYVGSGRVVFDGSTIAAAIATSTLRLLLKWNGSYTDAESGPYQVGLPEPSLPQVGILDDPIAGGTPSTNGLYSFKIARLRGTTGGKSRASATSEVLRLVGKAAYIVIPEASAGQTTWPIFVTERGLGGVGLHLRLSRANPFTGTEYTEEDVEREVSTLSVTNASPTVTDSAAGFTAQDEGKLFEAVSAGFSVPTGTTVLSVDSDSQITLSNNVTVASGSNPRTGRLTAYVNEIERAVSLNWTESDLAGEAAEVSWIYDFPPPAASHAFQLENRIAVAAYADSTAATGSDNPGTALIFSLSNQLESFDIRFPLYLPEAVIDILSRGVDSYRFIGCRNGIYAVQYINAEIPATLSVILANEGIANGNNWCVGKRGIYIFTATGKLVRIGEGARIDEAFYDDIRLAIKDWDQDATILSAETRAGGICVMNGKHCYYFDEQTEKWSARIHMDETAGLNSEEDFEIMGAIGIRGRMLVSIQPPLEGSETEDDVARRLHEFDPVGLTDGSSQNVVGTTAYQSLHGNHTFAIQEVRGRVINDVPNSAAWLAIHKNLGVTHFTDGTVDSGDLTELLSDSMSFDDSFIGKYLIIFGAAAGFNFVPRRIIEIVDEHTVVVGNWDGPLASATPLALPAIANAYVLVADRLFPLTLSAARTVQMVSPEIYLNGYHAVAASLVLPTTGANAQPLEITLRGHVVGEDWQIRGGTWG